MLHKNTHHHLVQTPYGQVCSNALMDGNYLQIRLYFSSHVIRQNRLFFLCGPSFRRAVQFNDNEAEGFGGGIAVEGGDVT